MPEQHERLLGWEILVGRGFGNVEGSVLRRVWCSICWESFLDRLRTFSVLVWEYCLRMGVSGLLRALPIVVSSSILGMIGVGVMASFLSREGWLSDSDTDTLVPS